MALIAYPAGSKTVRVTHELWYPNQIVLTLASGEVERIDRSPPRWRGTFTLDLADRGDESAALELFTAEFSGGQDWVDLPWPKRTIEAQTNATRGTGGLWTVNRWKEGLIPGSWVRIGNRLHLVRTVAGDRTGDQQDATTVTLLPDIIYTGVQAFTPAVSAQVRHLEPTPISVPADRYHSGPVTYPWVERLDV